MYQKLILKAFEKAGEEIQRSEPYPIANKLVDFIEDKTKETYTARSLVDKWNAAKEESETVRLKKFVVDALCLYLGYPNFEAFNRENPGDKTLSNWLIKNWPKCWFKFLLYNLILLTVGVAMYNYIVRERWMEWQEYHYREVPFDAEKLRQGVLKIYKQERIDDFKRVEVDCNTVSFNPDGSPKIWYGKNKDGVLEYFTDLGLHPETGVTLKKITRYMIDTHVCPNPD